MNICQFGFAASAVAVGWMTLTAPAAADEHCFDRDDDPRIRRGFEIAPVPLNLRGKDPALVGLGSYLVTSGGCNDCHTGRGPAKRMQLNRECKSSGANWANRAMVGSRWNYLSVRSTGRVFS
jgi:hypothetical protein